MGIARVAQAPGPAIVIYRRSHRFLQLPALWVAIAAASASFAGDKNKKAAPSQSPAFIEITGGILGVKLFAPLEEAREKMARFKLEKDATAESEEKEEREGDARMIWRLAETEYQWIVAWADKEGKVIKISASLRPEKKKPFKEIGDLGRAKVHNDSMAMWSVQHPDGASFRLVAKGPGEQALSIYLSSLKPASID